MSTPDHTPISKRALDELILQARENNDYYTGQKFLRRIDQAVPGMTAPSWCAPKDVQATAKDARRLFIAVVNESGDLDARTKLDALLVMEPESQGVLVLSVPVATPEEEVAA